MDFFQQHYVLSQHEKHLISKLPQGSPGWLTWVYSDGEQIITDNEFKQRYKDYQQTHGDSEFIKKFTRYGRINGSNCGRFAKDPEKYLPQYFSFQGNMLTMHGNKHEDFASQLVEISLQKDHPGAYLETSGLCIHPCDFAAYSPDGIWHLPGNQLKLNEIKCAVKQYPEIKYDHYCQITLGCATLNLTTTLYSVYTHDQLIIREYVFDSQFYHILIQKLEYAFWNILLPEIINREKQ